ncbi:SPOR domain-containing protein [Halothiobacillus sp. DCM-1]|uniref:SPOR domain-containing protein n=1 Tax=Halothiobacillus sp. DCM-1 TaxID=3112558 RepID=UPI003251C288
MASSKRAPTNRRRPADRSASSASKWVVLLLVGVVLVLAVLASHWWKKDQSPAEAGRQDARAVTKPAEKTPIKPDFEFYTLLPKENNGPVLPVPPPGNAPVTIAPSPAAPTPPSPDDAKSASAARQYLIQAGSFATEAEANRRKAEIAMQGFSSQIQSAVVNGKPYYRIQIGPVAESELPQLKKRLAAAHIDTLPPRALP